MATQLDQEMGMRRNSGWFTVAMAAISIVVVGSNMAWGEGDPARLKGSSRSEKDGWIYVHIEGSPEAIGYQHGYLLADEIADLLRVTKPFLEKTTKRDWAFYRDASRKMLWKGIDDEYRREIDAIVEGLSARGVKADRWDLVALNAIMELPYYYVPWLDKREGKRPATHAPGNCSAFVATGSFTRDGKIVMGHNNWTGYIVGTRWNIIFDLVPERGHRLLMDGMPGVITSDDDFAVNDAGLLVTETTITQFEGWDPDGKPEFVRSRKAMQYGSSIDDFARIMLDGNNGGYANDWLIGDVKTGEVAQLELGLKEHTLKRTRDGCFVGSNFPEGEALIKRETMFDPSNKASSPNARRKRWEQLIAENKGKIDSEVGKRFETDVFDAYQGQIGANERTLTGRVETSPRGVPEWDWGPYFPGGTVQSKVIDADMAAKMEFWAAIGHHNAPDFIADEFLMAHPEYGWMRGLLKDLVSRPWSKFSSKMK
jgi:Phospholipase B